MIGDVHGEDAALEAALAYLATLGPLDAILCTGDVAAKKGEGDTDRCCRLLADAGALCVRGNHDRWTLESGGDPALAAIGLGDRLASRASLAFLKALPETRTFATPLGKLLLCHGVGGDDMAGVYPGDDEAAAQRTLAEKRLDRGDYRVHLAGHTHRRMARTVCGVTLLNPGTLRWDEQPGFAVADFTEGAWTLYDLAPFTNEITQSEAIRLFTR